MFFDQYPYTNLHNVNLDWVLQAVKSWGAMVEQNNINFINLEAANQSFKEYVTNYLTNLDVSSEINAKLDEMLTSGQLTPYMQPFITSGVEEWLDEHITPTTPAIDASLTIAGAAADAKATGEAIAESKKFLYDVDFTKGSSIVSETITNSIVSQAGDITSNNNYNIQVANVTGNNFYWVKSWAALKAGNPGFCFYDNELFPVVVSETYPITSEKIVDVDTAEFEYLILAPRGAEKLYLNVRTTTSDPCIYSIDLDRNVIENLLVAERNLDTPLYDAFNRLTSNDALIMSNMTSGFSGDLTSEVIENKFIDANGNETNVNGFAIMKAPVTPGKWYKLFVYQKWTGGARLAFYDIDGYKIDSSFTYPDNTILLHDVGLSGGEYLIKAPDYAATVKTSVYMDTKRNRPTVSSSTITEETYTTYTLKGLRITSDNMPALNESVLHRNVVSKPIPNTGNLVVFGDSIAAGYGVQPSEAWPRLLANKFGYTLNNQSVSGITLATGIRNKILAFTGNADLIIIAGGTNDYNQGVVIGEFDSADNTTLNGALNEIIEYLATNYPSTPVIFLTPIPYLNTTPAIIDNMSNYRNAIYNKAITNGHSCINCDNIGFPDNVNAVSNALYADRIHPTAAGHKLLFNYICGQII